MIDLMALQTIIDYTELLLFAWNYVIVFKQMIIVKKKLYNKSLPIPSKIGGLKKFP